MPNKPSSPAQPAQTFESAIERLEAIVEQMEGDQLPLEQLIERYEEGSSLVKICQEKLVTAERRIEIITRNAAGKPQLVEFEPAGGAPVAAPAGSARSVADPNDEVNVSLF